MPFRSKGSQLSPSSGEARRPSTCWLRRWRSSSVGLAGAGEAADRTERSTFIMALVMAWSAGLDSLKRGMGICSPPRVLSAVLLKLLLFSIRFSPLRRACVQQAMNMIPVYHKLGGGIALAGPECYNTGKDT